MIASIADLNQSRPHDTAEGEAEAKTSTDLIPIPEGDSEVVEGDQAREVQEGPENGDDEANPEGTAAQPDGTTGQFPNSGFAPGFDQMQMMMAMQNGFNNFPMMGE